MAILLGFQDFFYSFNDSNEAQEHRPETENEQALFPVASIFLLAKMYFYIYPYSTEYKDRQAIDGCK